MCAGCPENVEPEYTPWLAHIMLVAMLQDGGCAFRPDDLSLEQWAGLAEYRAARERLAVERSREREAPAGSPAPIVIQR